MSGLHVVSHAEDGAATDAHAEGDDGAQIPPSINPPAVQSTRWKRLPAYRALRERAAQWLASALERYGAQAQWARRLDVKPQALTKYTTPGEAAAPDLPSLMLLDPADQLVIAKAWLAEIRRAMGQGPVTHDLSHAHLLADAESSDPARVLVAMDADRRRNPDELRRYAAESREAAESRLVAAEVAEREAARIENEKR